MTILPNRIMIIENNFFEFSFDSEEEEEEPIPDYAIFESLSSAEQFYLESIYNWDDGTIVLDWIIDSPKCDKGTATMIFWMAEPDYYFDCTEETVEYWARDVWKLLQKIISKIRKNEFKTSKFEFNPIQNGYKTDWHNAKGIWALPTDLVQGTTGINPITNV